MDQPDDELVKILCRFYSEVLESDVVENFWAFVVDKEKGLYKVDSICFYAAIASDDIVFAEYDKDEEALTFRKIIKASGNSIIQVVVLDKTVQTNIIRDNFHELGCKTEKFQEGYFVIEILADKNYDLIEEKLIDLESEEIISYAKAVLSDRHLG